LYNHFILHFFGSAQREDHIHDHRIMLEGIRKNVPKNMSLVI